jgi:hypothetical protein
MANLYGIETEQDCRDDIDELLQSPALRGTVNMETVSALKNLLKEYYNKGNSAKRKDQMSKVEGAFFWPAIQDAYVRAPNLAAQSTWSGGLYDINGYLRYHRPKEKR